MKTQCGGAKFKKQNSTIKINIDNWWSMKTMELWYFLGFRTLARRRSRWGQRTAKSARTTRPTKRPPQRTRWIKMNQLPSRPSSALNAIAVSPCSMFKIQHGHNESLHHCHCSCCPNPAQACRTGLFRIWPFPSQNISRARGAKIKNVTAAPALQYVLCHLSQRKVFASYLDRISQCHLFNSSIFEFKTSQTNWTKQNQQNLFFFSFHSTSGIRNRTVSPPSSNHRWWSPLRTMAKHQPTRSSEAWKGWAFQPCWELLRDAYLCWILPQFEMTNKI